MTTSNAISSVSLLFSIIAVLLTSYTLYEQCVNLKVSYEQSKTFIYPLFKSNSLKGLIVFISIYNPKNTGITITKITLTDKENTYISTPTSEDLIIRSRCSIHPPVVIPTKSKFLTTPYRLVNHDGVEGYCIFKDLPILDENTEEIYTLTVHTSNKNFSISINANFLNKDRHSKILPQNFMI